MGSQLTAIFRRAISAVTTVSFGLHELPDTHALPDGARIALTNRRDALIEATGAAGPELAGRLIGRLFEMFPAAGADSADIARLISNHAKSVSHAPAWAIAEAIQKIRDSGARFRPSEPEFVRVVADCAAPARAELADISRLLSAKVYHVPAETERDRVKARFSALVAGIGTASGASAAHGDSDRPRRKA
jgi:hypothetical protein